MNIDREKRFQSDSSRMKVVLDTNVLVSALIKAGKPRDLFKKLAKDKQIIFSKPILEEFLDVIEDPKVARYINQQDVATFLNILGNGARIIRVKSKVQVVINDADDNIIVQAAHDGNASYIVSGDKHLLALKEFKGIKVVTVDQMLVILSN
jgi:putative PIN family toxin of toxin-antitoxin system